MGDELFKQQTSVAHIEKEDKSEARILFASESRFLEAESETGKEATRKNLDEMSEIENILSGKYKLDKNRVAEDRAFYESKFDDLKLYHVEMHDEENDVSHILRDGGTGQISGDFESIRDDIYALSRLFMKCSDTSDTEESIAEITDLLQKTCKSCEEYLDKKSPTFKRGKLRYKLVRNVYSDLLEMKSNPEAYREADSYPKLMKLADRINEGGL